MAVIVQKFGGTSVADSQKLLRCARRAVEARKNGHDVVVVVSAMGHTTDELIELAEQVTARPEKSESSTKSAAPTARSAREIGWY